jgi:hypothetical protein
MLNGINTAYNHKYLKRLGPIGAGLKVFTIAPHTLNQIAHGKRPRAAAGIDEATPQGCRSLAR